MIVDFLSLAQQCAPTVSPTTLHALVKTESGFNPFAIGVVGGHLIRQPKTTAEAVATARALDAQGINFSMGLGQVNKKNLTAQGLSYDSVFASCENLRASGNILTNCYQRAAAKKDVAGGALNAAFSCYYSGNFERGFRADFHGTSYVQRVASNAGAPKTDVPVVPAIPVVMDGDGHKKNTHSSSSGKPSANTESPETSHDENPKKSWDAFGDLSSTK